MKLFKRKPLKKLTEREFLEKIIKICEENPDNVNPRNYFGSCAYDLGGDHCLIGEFLVSEGIPIKPEWDKKATTANRVFRELGVSDDKLLTSALKVQSWADARICFNFKNIDTSWGEVGEYTQDLLDDLPK